MIYSSHMSKRVHFIGIGGSGLSAVAQIAKNFGYDVDGCDMASETPYLEKVKKAGIRTFVGHHPDHLKGVDLVAVTPAMFYQNRQDPELVEGQRLGILKKWQDFLGQDLHRGKFVISIAGTHGKSTTTAWAGELLAQASLDPTVEVGATVTAWKNNIRLGKSQYFISEADEFDNNFASYQSDVAILTMIELDHPEYFGTYSNMLEIFNQFLAHLNPKGLLIYNADSQGCKDLKLPQNSISYSYKQITNLIQKPNNSSFTYQNQNYQISLPGLHNIQNSLAIIELGKYLKIKNNFVFNSLKNFSGTGRRLELLGEKNGVKVYDDYANHPSSFKASLDGVIQQNPNSKIIAVIEPHTFSRLRSMLSELPESLKNADEVIVSKIFASREKDPGNFTGEDIAAVIPNGKYVPEFPNIVQYLKTNTQPKDIVLVMGSGNSHLLSRQILESL